MVQKLQNLDLEHQSPIATFHSTNMIRRSFLRHTQVLKHIPQSSRINLVTPCSYKQILYPSLPSRILPRRYYSAAPETASTTASTSDPPASETVEEADPIKQELEAKNREIIDLKVRVARVYLYGHCD